MCNFSTKDFYGQIIRSFECKKSSADGDKIIEGQDSIQSKEMTNRIKLNKK